MPQNLVIRCSGGFLGLVREAAAPLSLLTVAERMALAALAENPPLPPATPDALVYELAWAGHSLAVARSDLPTDLLGLIDGLAASARPVRP